jgi:hypothetical protein
MSTKMRIKVKIEGKFYSCKEGVNCLIIEIGDELIEWSDDICIEDFSLEEVLKIGKRV